MMDFFSFKCFPYRVIRRKSLLKVNIERITNNNTFQILPKIGNFG